MNVFIAEAEKLTVVDYFIAFFCKFFYLIELLEEVRDWCGLIPTFSHAIKIGCEIRRGDGSILSVYVIEKGKQFTFTNLVIQCLIVAV